LIESYKGLDPKDVAGSVMVCCVASLFGLDKY
jgi:hypothetical protein